MNPIRKATAADLSRIAEIFIFNYRLQFYPIFKSDVYYFSMLQVTSWIEQNRDALSQMWVYDDGVVKGFIQLDHGEVKRLFVEPILQGQSIGAKLLQYAIREHGAYMLWALEKNARAIRFYERHGFHMTSDRKLEEDTTEYLVRLER